MNAIETSYEYNQNRTKSPLPPTQWEQWDDQRISKYIHLKAAWSKLGHKETI